MKISEVVDKILAYHPRLEDYHGCDEYKCGDPVARQLPAHYVPTGDAFSYV